MFTFDDGAAFRQAARKAFTPIRRQPSETIGREATVNLILDIFSARPPQSGAHTYVAPKEASNRT